MDWWGSITSGIISGFVASALFFLCVRGIRPKIHISDNISVYPNDDGKESLRIKIINRRFREAEDITFQLYMERRIELFEGPVKFRWNIMKTEGGVQPGRKLIDKERDYARRVRLDAQTLLDVVRDVPDGYLVAEVSARDSASGVRASFRRKFELPTNCKHGTFESGNSDKILPYVGDLPFALPGALRAARQREENQPSA